MQPDPMTTPGRTASWSGLRPASYRSSLAARCAPREARAEPQLVSTLESLKSATLSNRAEGHLHPMVGDGHAWTAGVGARRHRPRSFLSPRATTSNSRHPKVISLVESREETWDGKAERKDRTGHRFDRRRRPARCTQARASRRAGAGAWP